MNHSTKTPSMRPMLCVAILLSACAFERDWAGAMERPCQCDGFEFGCLLGSDHDPDDPQPSKQPTAQQMRAAREYVVNHGNKDHYQPPTRDLQTGLVEIWYLAGWPDIGWYWARAAKNNDTEKTYDKVEILFDTEYVRLYTSITLDHEDRPLCPVQVEYNGWVKEGKDSPWQRKNFPGRGTFQAETVNGQKVGTLSWTSNGKPQTLQVKMCTSNGGGWEGFQVVVDSGHTLKLTPGYTKE